MPEPGWPFVGLRSVFDRHLRPPRRLPSVTTTVKIGVADDGGGGHTLEISLVYLDTEPAQLVEVVFQSAGKIGSGLDLLLQELGIKLSRFIQGRHPETGEPL